VHTNNNIKTNDSTHATGSDAWPTLELQDEFNLVFERLVLVLDSGIDQEGVER
jgi:hypothetical protein